MDGMDLDFAKYVAYRRGRVEQRARDGAAYSYPGEHKVRRGLVSTRPVVIAIEATTRLWKASAKKELLDVSERADDRTHGRVYRSTLRAAQTLGIGAPPVYVAPAEHRVDVRALGAEADACVVINRTILDRLDDSELLALIGHELGHIQNNHIPYTTALYYLRHNAVFFVRWVVQPAIMTLQAWSRRAEISCDRAALLVTRDIDATLSSMVKVSDPDLDVEAYLAEVPATPGGVGKFAEYFRTYPLLSKRVQALRVFAQSTLYKKLAGPLTDQQGDQQGGEGLSADEVERRVGEILSVH